MVASGPSKEAEMRFGETVFADVAPSAPVGDAARISALGGGAIGFIHLQSPSRVLGESLWREGL